MIHKSVIALVYKSGLPIVSFRMHYSCAST